jgi:dTDP-D-glucose 4,6-dehydratase
LIEFGQKPWDENTTVANHIIAALDELEINQMIENKLLITIIEAYRKANNEGESPNAKFFLYHEDETIKNMVIKLMEEETEISPNWKYYYQGYIATREDLYKEEVSSTLNYLQLRKIKKLIAENQAELEKTNEPYAIAKIAGIKMCENYNFQYKTNYISLMPSNSYGPNDNYDSKNSHFFASLIKKIHIAKINNKKSIKLWGNGKAQRELIYVGDIADACIYFMGKKIKDSLINIGTGKCFTIYQYAKFIMKQLNVRMEIELDKTMPNGTPKKLLDISLAKKYGWSAKIDLKTGFNLTYRSFLKENFISKK